MIDLVFAPGLALVVASVVATVAAAAVSAHVLLTKEEPRAAIGWIGLVWLSPVVGGLLYLVFGINRVRRQAHRLRPRALLAPPPGPPPSEAGELDGLRRAMDRIAGGSRCDGNAVTLLDSGEEAYPAMLGAIDAATRSIALSTYIFDRDAVGEQFVEALGRAVRRGVAVRVLIDALGARYSLPTVVNRLRRLEVPVARFLPARPWSVAFLNLRNHRKILVIDGRIGFTGGMNLREHHLVRRAAHPARDLHARVDGPVVAQLLDVFAADWAWTTGEALDGSAWATSVAPAGDVRARVVRDGPDEDLDRATLAFVAGLACARHSVRVVTPYFLPEEPLVLALHAAALRGVEVDVLLPERNNLPYLTWAARAELPRVLACGVRAWWVPPPFDHTKLMVVDRRWTLLGSANWDARSLRLNFELLLEADDPALGAQADDAALERRARARPVSAEALASAPLWVRLRDATARLGKPYL